MFVAPARHGPAVFHSRFRLSWNTLGDSARRSALSRTQASSARRTAGRARPARDPRPARASRQRVSVNFRVSTVYGSKTVVVVLAFLMQRLRLAHFRLFDRTLPEVISKYHHETIFR